jgi:hypothetical protein
MPVHPNVKKALVEASELDTVLVMRALRNTERVLSAGRTDLPPCAVGRHGGRRHSRAS